MPRRTAFRLAGSCDPGDRTVLAIEPSIEMLRQRPPTAALAGLRRIAPRQIVLAYDTHRILARPRVHSRNRRPGTVSPCSTDIANAMKADSITPLPCGFTDGVSRPAKTRSTSTSGTSASCSSSGEISAVHGKHSSVDEGGPRRTQPGHCFPHLARCGHAAHRGAGNDGFDLVRWSVGGHPGLDRARTNSGDAYALWSVLRGGAAGQSRDPCLLAVQTLWPSPSISPRPTTG
ncbi:hypothetical protein SAMN05421854_106355 [Amycolatopsis rubida]|uniref:Uncharacterized protein n=1 Tax=Amycolatopsis rubida TaxID=112413 RepID=A0A1I5SKM5_9PSEU|nr:hypothetical protein SAMN05421854_106355 [Amycolatopsis rubida]